MSKTPFKVLKLKSGDDVIAKLVKNTKDKIQLERPMVMKIMHYVEPMSGAKKETVILYDWLKTTIENKIMIEKDFVVGIFHPDPDILKAYEIQKNMDDQAQKGFIVDKLPKTKTNPPSEGGMENILRMVKDRIDQERKNIEEYFEDGNSFLEDIVEASDEEVTLVNDDIEKREDYGNSYTDWSPNPEDYLT